MSDLVETGREGEVGILTINNPPVNALSPGVPEGIIAGIEQFEKDRVMPYWDRLLEEVAACLPAVQ